MRIEGLQSRVAAIADENAAPLIHRDAVRKIELPRFRALAAPFELVMARGVELHHARVAVTIAHVKGTVREHGDIGWQIEMRLVRTGVAALAESQQETPVVRVLEDLLPADVGEPHIVFGVGRAWKAHAA